MLAWYFWYSDLLSTWVSGISAYMDVLIYWWSDISKGLGIWGYADLIHLIFWYSGSLSIWDFCICDLLINWWSDISKGLGIWGYADLNLLIFWFSGFLSIWGVCIHDLLTHWQSDWSGGLGIWEYAGLKFLVFWVSDFRKGNIWSFWASEFLKSSEKFWFQKTFRISDITEVQILGQIFSEGQIFCQVADDVVYPSNKLILLQKNVLCESKMFYNSDNDANNDNSVWAIWTVWTIWVCLTIWWHVDTYFIRKVSQSDYIRQCQTD